MVRSLANIAGTYELQPSDRSLLVMPLFHVHGLMAGAPAGHVLLAMPTCSRHSRCGAALHGVAATGCLAVPPELCHKRAFYGACLLACPCVFAST